MYVKLISKPKHLLSNDYPWGMKWIRIRCLYFIQWLNIWTVSSSFTKWKNCSKVWPLWLEQSNRLISIDSKRSTAQPTVLNQQSVRFTIVKCFHSDLADFVRLSYPSGKRWKSHNCSSYVLDFSEHILDFCCLEISTFQLGKVWTKSPLAEWLLKFYWTP